MSGSQSDPRRLVGAGAIATVGTLTLLAQAAHLFEEPTLDALALGVLIPVGLSAALVGVGVWLYRSDVDGHGALRVAGWTGLGIVGGVLFGSPVVPYQAAHGVILADVPFVVVNWLTVGALGGALVGFYDARRRRYRRALESEHAELEREIDRLETFAGIVSHDLRNPMNVATGRIDLARETGDDAHLDDAMDALERMDAIIDDVLTMAREGEAIDDDEIESLELGDLARSSWSTTDVGDATLRVETDLTFRGDESRAKHVFENLFRNAVEHGGDGVEVRVGALPDGDGFFVADDGPGIPADEREAAFEPGFTTESGGTGYGLYIVRTIAAAHGWDVRTTTAEDGGARFEFSGV